MDKKILKMAAELMRELGLTEIKLKDGDTEIEMKRQANAYSPAPAAQKEAEIRETDSSDSDEYMDVLCPLIGVFRLTSAEGEPPFVVAGSRVKKGDVLCIIESMKMQNEITSDCDGTVASIFVSDDTLVEYGHPLFRIIPD